MKNNPQYDAFAKDFSQSRSHAWPEFELIEAVLGNITCKKSPEDKVKILDIGCGNGRLFKFLPEDLREKIDYIGADISEGMLEEAKAKNCSSDTHSQNAPQWLLQDFAKTWRFEDETFDMVISVAAFHHLLDKNSQNFFLQEARRVLRPDGKIFLTTWIFPSKHFWPNFWSGRYFTKNWNIPFGKEKHPRTYRRVTGSDLVRLFVKNKFSVDYVQDFRGRNFVGLAHKL